MTPIEMRWQKGNSRYYKISIYKDLLNDLILTQSWGGLHSRLGNYKHVLIQSTDEADKLLSHIIKRRLKRGYKLISSTGTFASAFELYSRIK